MKRISTAGFSIFLLVFLGWGLHFLTDGFRLSKLQSSLDRKLPWKVEPLPQFYDKIFDQSFHYLGKGRQSFVFSSEDGKTVLKLIRYDRITPAFWAKLSLFHTLFPKRMQKEIKSRYERFAFNMSSYQIAMEELAEETGLLSVHIHRTELPSMQVTLHDKMGRKYSIDLNKYGFILQKKALLMGPAVICCKDEKKFQQLLSAYLEVISVRFKKGFHNKDHNWVANYGILKDRVLEIDVGRYYKRKESTDPNALLLELNTSTRFFRAWLEKKWPNRVSYLDKEIRKQVDQYDLELKNDKIP